MLIDELRERLQTIEADITAIKDFYASSNLESEYDRLSALALQEEFWKHPDQVSISQQLQSVRNTRREYTAITSSYEECLELVDLFEESPTELEGLAREVKTLCKRIGTFKINLLLSKEEDKKNCFVSINAGAGGTESQDWANMLLRMYLRFCERENLLVDILDHQAGEEAGIKSATLFVKGSNAYGFLKTEAGIHRLVRISPFDTNKRRHTSFAGITVTPEVKDAKIEIKDDDLRIDTYRAGGKGGQHVNKTDSAVRITHMPSGIVVQCQNERSQFQNKQTALKMLMSRLVEKQEQEKREKAAAAEKKKIEWGSQIRSYVLHPYKMVKDHRTGLEHPQPDVILDGEIMAFIEKVLTTQS